VPVQRAGADQGRTTGASRSGWLAARATAS